jgi:hypothetical protein
MTQYERLEKAANMYIIARKALKEIDKAKEPDRYDRYLEIAGITALILRKNGVSIHL